MKQLLAWPPFLILAVALSACQPGVSPETVIHQDAVVVANTTRLGIVSAEAAAAGLYRAELMDAIKDVQAKGGSRIDAESAVARVQARWKTTRDAFEQARKAHALLVAALEAYRSGIAVVHEGERIEPSLDSVIRMTAQVVEFSKRVATLVEQLRDTTPME